MPSITSILPYSTVNEKQKGHVTRRKVLWNPLALIKKQDITNYQSFFKAKALFYGKITID